MAQSLFQPPGQFSFKPADWLDWYADWKRYIALTEIDQKADATKISALLYNMGTRKAEKVMQTFKYGKKRVPNPAHANDAELPATIEVDEKATVYDDVIGKFDHHYVPKINIVNESANFNKRVQRGETIDSFLIDLQQLVIKCDYQDPDRQVRDRFIAGLKDDKLQEKLQFMPDVTLERAVDYSRRWEMLQEQLKQQRSDTATASEVRTRGYRGRGHGQARGRGHGRQGNFGGQPKTQQSTSTSKCQRCGYSYHKNKICPAVKAKCNQCSKIGHFGSVCKSSAGGPPKAHEVQVVDDHQQAFASSDMFLGAVDCTNQVNRAWFTQLKIGSDHVQFKIDTGADVTILSKESYDRLSHPPALQTTSLNLMSPGGQVLTLGEFTSHVKHKGTAYKVRIIVITGDKSTNLLARDVAFKMKLIARLDEIDHYNSGKDIGLMKTSPVKIHLKDSIKPVCLPTARRVPFPLMGAVKDELERMVKSDVIVPVTEPTDWCSAMVPVVKKNGSVRLCVDLKNLNHAVRRPHCTLPTLEDIAPKLATSTVFSTLDAASGFWQIPLDEGSQKLTTFITPFGRFMFKRLPFGISLATDEYQSKMMELFGAEEGVEVIIDDILVHGKTREEHDQRLKRVMEIVKKVGLRLNKEKCKLRMAEVTYFGHLVGKEGIKPNPERTLP